MTPHAEYARRLADLRADEARLDRRLAAAGNARFAVALVVPILVIILAVFRSLSPTWLLVPVAGFVAPSVMFLRAQRRLAGVRRAAAYYDLGVARLEDRWPGRGVTGDEFLDPNHPFAADLDLFGRGSVFELLCTARTRAGRATLAGWLLHPVEPDEIVRRQEAVRELADWAAWRERLALAGDDLPAGMNTDAVARWGMVPPGPPTATVRRIAVAIVLVSLIALGGLQLDWWSFGVPATALLVQLSFAVALRSRVQAAIAELDGRSRDLFHLAGLLACIEGESFTAAKLKTLQAGLTADGEPPSRRLGELAGLVGKLDATKNQFFGLVAPLLLWTTRTALAAADWRRHAGPAIGRWTVAVAEAEALASLATYAHENPDDVYPEIVPPGPLFEAVGLCHPLMPRDRCVPNDVALNADVRLLVVSGSNMAGKSTLLRAVGVAAVLTQAGAPVRAKHLRLSPLAVGATLRIQDSLQSGRSRFYAEITRLRQVVALADGPWPVLYLLDELLAGTNSHDRRVGAAAILRGLVERRAIGLVTTHDLALTHVAEELAPHAVNVHFADEFVDGELHFDYHLRPDVVRHSNALALMRAVGLEIKER
jgi:hypothetical protein